MKHMKTNMKILLFILFPCTLFLIFFSCFIPSNKVDVIPELEIAETPVRIGFSQTDCSNPWRTIQLMSFKESAKIHGYELIYYEPEEDSTVWQRKNLQHLLLDNPDYLVISPKDISALKDLLLEIEEMGIGIILVDTDKVIDPAIRYLTRISSNYSAEGQLCAKALAEYFNGDSAKIIEITGDPELDYTQIRSASFAEELLQHRNLSIAATVNGNFDSETSIKAIEKIVSDGDITFNAIFAHSDEAGIGALQALKVAGKDIHSIPIVSINGSQDALKAIIAEEYVATITSSPGIGTVVMSAIAQHQAGYELPEWILIPNKIYNRMNALENYNYAY